MSQGVPPLDDKLQLLVDAARASDDLSPASSELDAVGGRLWASLGLIGVPPAAVGLGAAATAAGAGAASASAGSAAGASAGAAVGAGAGASAAATGTGAAAAAGSGAAAVGAATVGGLAGLSVAVKLTIVAAAFGVAATTTYVVTRSKRDTRSQIVASVAPAARATSSPAAQATSSPAAQATSSLAAQAPRAATGAPSAKTVRESKAPTLASPPSTVAPTVAAAAKTAKGRARAPRRTRGSTIGAERVLLDRARTALAAKRPRRALRVLRVHRRTYAAGALAEERDALSIMALAGAGELVRARASARRFRRQHPRSMLWRAIERALRRSATSKPGATK